MATWGFWDLDAPQSTSAKKVKSTANAATKMRQYLQRLGMGLRRSSSSSSPSSSMTPISCHPLPAGAPLRPADLPSLWPREKRLEEESRPTEEWEWRGEAMGLSAGVEWTEVAVLVSLPSCESRDGLCT
jgi:hypothetical protein